ncbi:fluoride efflux transporter CrcB [Lichenibacterium dinghuense]|uniref:fluoride efflux transporter CrcB n=1 Tax=Lichenibacterium dinghuense TaxID=2895977 RepID=UPI001F2E560F|nr:fluoride efflux transporter CrcB [Lichenibacterium sp. 6Y81]
MNLTTCLVVALGGAIGTFGRYALALAMAPISGSLPWGTVIINIAGSFVIGFFGTLTLAHGRYPVPENLRLFVLVGLCGGFTTFSSFSLQTFDLLRAGAVGRALVNVGVSVVLCLCAVAVGHLAAAQLNGGAVSVVQASVEEDA